MRTKIAAMLLILLLGLIPASIFGAADGDQHTLDEALLLMVSGELWLTGGGQPVADMDETMGLVKPRGRSTGTLQAVAINRVPGLIRSAASPFGTARQTEVSINAVKEVIAMKQAAHKQSTSMLEGKVSEEILQGHQEKYDQDMKLLNGVLEELRRQWRREKRFLPKLVKPFKQAGGWFWHKIGPAGRRILRAVGDDLIKMAVAGDPVSGQVLKLLIVKHARALGEQRGKEFLARLVLGRRTKDRQQTEVVTDKTGDTTGDETEEMTLDEFWEVVYADLVSQQLHCNQEQITYYKECIVAAANRNESWDSAFESCNEIREYLIPYPRQAELEDFAYFHMDNDNYFSLAYDMDAGAVSGRYEVVYLDYGSFSRDDPNVEPCLVTLLGEFTGQIDEASCSLSGNRTHTLILEGSESSQCFWQEPYEGTSERTWQAKVDRGAVNGEVGASFHLNFEEHAKVTP